MDKSPLQERKSLLREAAAFFTSIKLPSLRIETLHELMSPEILILLGNLCPDIAN